MSTQIKTHIQVIAWIYIALGLLGIVIALLAGAFVIGGGLISGDNTAIQVTTLVAFIITGLVFLFMLPGIIAGVGLLKYKAWARILAIILGLLNLPGFPIGTLVGVYTIWALLDTEAQALFTPAA
jgi:hypothetical protein